MIKVVCWNIARRWKPLYQLAKAKDADVPKRYRPLHQISEMDADVALLQEVGPGMARKLPSGLETGSRRHWDSRLWSSRRPSRWAMVVKMSDRVDVEWFDQVGKNVEPSANEIALSRVNSLAVARVTPKDPKDGKPLMVASMYAHWQKPPYRSSRSTRAIVNDLSAFIGRNVPDSDRILAAGDINVNYTDFRSDDFQDSLAKKPVCDEMKDKIGYVYRIYKDDERYTVMIYDPNGEVFRIYKGFKTLRRARGWRRRNMKIHEERLASRCAELRVKVWDRMKEIGLEFMGPQHPNGRQPDSFPSFVPANSENVVTYHLSGESPATGKRQLDYVFASRNFHERVSTRALNGVAEWGASDHCRIMIEVAPE